jgi:hypothetical protein
VFWSAFNFLTSHRVKKVDLILISAISQQSSYYQLSIETDMCLCSTSYLFRSCSYLPCRAAAGCDAAAAVQLTVIPVIAKADSMTEGELVEYFAEILTTAAVAATAAAAAQVTKILLIAEADSMTEGEPIEYCSDVLTAAAAAAAAAG